MKRTRESGLRRGLLTCGLLILAGSSGILFGKAPKKQKVTEVFHVARVGQVGAAETRETLLALYERVSRNYNEQVEREQKKNPQVFKGERVRIIKQIDDQDAHGHLFLVAYDGGPSVMSVAGTTKLKAGNLSPPLIISEAGQHTVEITRRIRIKDKNQRQPTLEVVNENEGSNPPTFFGIPIDGGGGNTSGGGNNSGNRKVSGPAYKTVTETNTLKKFQATVSTERIDNRPRQMTQELFVKKLKNGEYFAVSQTEQRRCRECIGFGRVTPKTGARDADGKVAYPLCKSVGTLTWDVTYQVYW